MRIQSIIILLLTSVSLTGQGIMLAGSAVAEEPGGTSLLDDYPEDVYSAYSLRNLYQLYSGNVIRVRRSTDNSESDFTASEITDGTLTTFCGSGNGFVSVWYDQTGNNRNFVQSGLANQPTIVSAGVLQTNTAGNPAIKFGGTDVKMRASSVSVSQPFNVFFVAEEYGRNQLNSFYDSDAVRSTAFWSSSATLYYMYSGNSISELSSNTTTNTTYLYNNLHSGASSISRLNGNQIVSGNAGALSMQDLYIGANEGRPGSANAFAEIYLTELVIYSANKTTDFSGIESNINNYFNIY